MSLSEDAKAPYRNLDRPQGKEVLLCQEVVGTLYISHLENIHKKDTFTRMFTDTNGFFSTFNFVGIFWILSQPLN